MKLQILSILLTVLMNIVELHAFAAFNTSTKINVGTLYYYLDTSNNKVTSMPSGYYIRDIEIPSFFIYNSTNFDVTRIENYAFDGSSGLTAITNPIHRY